MLGAAWEPSDTIALSSVIVTGIVAVVAVAGHLYTSSRQRREDRRRSRYDELARAYREIGKGMDDIVEGVQLASVGQAVNIPLGTRSSYALLQLHGASLTVLRASAELIKRIRAMTEGTERGESSTDEQHTELTALVALFYTECNRHLQVVWPRLDPLDLRKPEVDWPEDPIFDRWAGKEAANIATRRSTYQDAVGGPPWSLSVSPTVSPPGSEAGHIGHHERH